jgi:hypothetical protein
MALIGIAVVVGIIVLYVYRMNGDLRPIANTSPTSTTTPLLTPSPTPAVHRPTGSPKPTQVKSPSVPSPTPTVFATPVRPQRSLMSEAQIEQCFLKEHSFEDVRFIGMEGQPTCKNGSCSARVKFEISFSSGGKQTKSEIVHCTRN